MLIIHSLSSPRECMYNLIDHVSCSVLRVVLAVHPVYWGALRENTGQSSTDSEGAGNVYYSAFTRYFNLIFI